MLVIFGCLFVCGAVLGGFSMAGGQFMALVHPSEVVTIGGAALGAMIIMSPSKVLKDLMKGLIATMKGSPYNKAAYEDLFKAMYDLFKLSRREGLLALEKHISDPTRATSLTSIPNSPITIMRSSSFAAAFRRSSMARSSRTKFRR